MASGRPIPSAEREAQHVAQRCGLGGGASEASDGPDEVWVPPMGTARANPVAMRSRPLGLLGAVTLLTAALACEDEIGDPSIGGNGGGGASTGGSAQGAGPATGGAAAGGAAAGGEGGAGGGGAAPDCAVDWVLGIHELTATSLPHSAALSGGDLVLAGETSPVEHFYDNSGFYAQPLLVRLTPSGQEVWRVTMPATNDAYVGGMGVGADGTIFLAGSFSGELTVGAVTLTAAGADAFVAALSPEGEVLWVKQFGDGGAQRAQSLAVDGAGNLVIGGTFQGSIDFGGGALSSTLGPDIFLVRLDADGDHLASRAIADAEFDSIWSLDVAADDSVLIGAEHVEDLMGADYVAAYAPDLGVELWRTDTNVSEPQVRARADGTLVVAGAYLKLLHLDEGGAEISQATYDAGNFGLIYTRLATTPDGLTCLTGAAMAVVDLGTGPLTADENGDAVIACYDIDWAPTFVTLLDGGTWSAVGRYLPLGPGSGVVSGQFEDGLGTCGGAAASVGLPDGFAAQLAY